MTGSMLQGVRQRRRDWSLLWIVAIIIPIVVSKEIQATKEWQRLGVNDTVAAGMHIRIDMTTGEKWVKLDDDDSSTDSSRNFREMQISAVDGEAMVVDDANSSPTYDYEMMYRALSKLPNDEKERIGLPDMDDVDRDAKLQEIWKQRQEMLHNVEVAELPKLLKERIHEIKEFKQRPIAQLNAEDDDDVHIIAVVKDLEFHLQDIDMTRDFHTLGGWTELASLLSDTVIQQSIKAEQTNNETTSFENGFMDFGLVIDNIHRLQTVVAWALGTAVKNTAEFAPYVVEYLEVEPKMTILEVVVSQLRKYTEGKRLSDEEKEKTIKIVYCLGSFLRGNEISQQRILEYDGPKVVAEALSKASSSGDASDAKIANRLLKIATDMTMVDASWKIPEFCDAVESTLSLTDSMAVLEGILAFAPSCPLWQSESSVVKPRVRTMIEKAEDGSEIRTLSESVQKALDMEIA